MEDGFAFIAGSDFQDGTIEADLALKIITPPGVRMPGFIGIGFHARQDASHYELIYIRPGNSRSEDQAMRNHTVQYTPHPGLAGMSCAEAGRGSMSRTPIWIRTGGPTSD